MCDHATFKFTICSPLNLLSKSSTFSKARCIIPFFCMHCPWPSPIIFQIRSHRITFRLCTCVNCKSTQNDEKVYNGLLRIKIYFRATAFLYTQQHQIMRSRLSRMHLFLHVRARTGEVYHNIKHHFIKFPLFNSLHLLLLSLPGTGPLAHGLR